MCLSMAERWDLTLHNAPPEPFITTHHTALLHLQDNLFFELFPLKSLPFTFLRGQAIKKLFYFTLSFRIPKEKKKRKKKASVNLASVLRVFCFLLFEH